MDPALVLVMLFAIAVLFVFAIVLTCWQVTGPIQEKFNRQFPPISDDEFLARCTLGTRPEVALKVRRIVAHSLAVPYEQIYPSTRFVDDLGAD